MKLVTNRHLRGEMGESAKRRVTADFCDTLMAESYQRLYFELAEGHAAKAPRPAFSAPPPPHKVN